MIYAEKLRDPRWIAFRDEFIRSRATDGRRDAQCDDCGEDTRGPIHVHHRRYVRGLEPWEYGYDDLRLICEDCHELIHETENLARAFIIARPPHLMHEIRQVFQELAECGSDGLTKLALAHAKNAIRHVRHMEGMD